MKNIKYNVASFLLSLMLVFTPLLTNAQNPKPIGCSLATEPKIQDILTYIHCIINRSFIPLVFTLATLLFVYGVMQFMFNGADESKREKGKQFMVWGIVALTVMLCVWGLVNLLGGTFGVNTRIVPSVTPN